jgi:hypothetical protein
MKQMKKFWLMLCGIAIVASIVMNPNTARADYDMQTGKLIENPSFETEAISSIPGWTQALGSSGVSVSQAQAFDLNNSLLINDTSGTNAIGMESSKEAATSGTSYKASTKVYVATGTAAIYVRFWDSSNTLLSSFAQSLSSPLNTWTDLSVTGLAPTGTAKVSALLYSSQSAITTAYFDNVAIDRVIRNGGFEEAASGSVIPGWSLPYGTSGISVVSTEQHSGSWSFKLNDTSSTTSTGIESAKLPTVAGEKFRATTQVKVTTGTASIYVRFWDSSGTLLQSWSETSGVTSGWQPLEVIGTAPTSTASVSMLLYSGVGAVTTAYFDDAALVGAFTNLQTQLSVASMYSSAIGTNASGNPVMAAGLYGNPAKFLVIDIHGETVQRVETLGVTGVPTTMVTASDGTIYAESGAAGSPTGELYKYVPSTDTFSAIGNVSGEKVLYSMAAGTSGTIYGGSYQNNKLWKRTSSGTISDLLGPVDTGTYSKGVSFDAATNSLYVSTGVTQAKLYKYDLSSGTRSSNVMPAAYASEEIADITRPVGNKLFLRMIPSLQGVVLNKSTYAVEHVITKVDSLDYTAQSPIDDKVYYTTDGVLYSYDLSSQTETSLVDLGANLLAGSAFLQLSEPNLSGYSLVGMTRAGTLIKYNLSTGFLKKATLNLPEQPVRLKYMIGGDDGKIYSGGYLGSVFGIYDPATGRTVQHSGIGTNVSIGQTEGAGKYGGKLYFGIYPSAHIFEYDPAQPYNYGTNPHELFEIGSSPNLQDRPFAVLGVDAYNKLFVGTVARYGLLPGALTVYDFTTGTVQVNKNIVTNQSVISLAYKNGKVYGGTTIAGGLGATPTATEAKLFVWDIATGTKTFETVPVAGKKSITSLVTGTDGNIWGFADDTLFVFNPTTNTVTYSASKFSVSHPLGTWFDVFMGVGTDGNFYGTIESLGQFFQLSPSSKNITILRDTGASTLFAQDTSGNIYFSNNTTDMWQYTDTNLIQ